MLLIVLIFFSRHCFVIRIVLCKAEAVNCHEIVCASCDFRFIACYEAHELQISGRFKKSAVGRFRAKIWNEVLFRHNREFANFWCFYHRVITSSIAPNSDVTKDGNRKYDFIYLKHCRFTLFFTDKKIFSYRENLGNIAFVKSGFNIDVFLHLIIYLPIRTMVPLSKCVRLFQSTKIAKCNVPRNIFPFFSIEYIIRRFCYILLIVLYKNTYERSIKQVNVLDNFKLAYLDLTKRVQGSRVLRINKFFFIHLRIFDRD